MKLFTYFAVFAGTSALECFTCAGKDFDKCVQNGSTETCQENQEVCQVHQRKRDGAVYRVNIRTGKYLRYIFKIVSSCIYICVPWNINIEV